MPAKAVAAPSLVALWLAACLLGCGRGEDIRVYSVPNVAESTDAETAAGPKVINDGRLLGAIVPRNDVAWYFKMTGENDAVLAQLAPFYELIRSVEFDDAGRPKWSLPDGWREEPGGGMRAATLVAGPDDDAPEASVIGLPVIGDDLDAYILDNVNRWRGQVERGPLPALPADGLTEDPDDELRTIALADGTEVLLMNAAGPIETGGPMSGRGGPFSGGGPFAGAAAPPAVSRTAPPAAVSLKYDTPDGWEPLPAGGFRKAAFKLGSGDATGEVTVIDLPAAANELLPNVNRWRGQVALPEANEIELASSIEPLTVGGRQAAFVELYGPVDGILGIIAEIDEKAWFVKLTAPVDLAKAERDAFVAFAESLEFDAP